MSARILDRIGGPADVRTLAGTELTALAEEVRGELLRVVSRQGGHLASNLGIVELTVALLAAFDLDRDAIVWDTGHSAYVYKLLTGRRDLLQTLRQDGGCCGFLNRAESPYDVFGAGHAGTAISAALGMAAARDRLGEDGRVVALVGDGALGCGSSLEGLNSVIETTDDFILVLNDNRMSIAPNVGALSRCLSRMIPNPRYNLFRRAVSAMVLRIPRIGPRLKRFLRRTEEAAKSVLVPGIIFEELGLRYIGPLDGHDVQALADVFTAVRRMREPVVIHVLTEKGRGYEHAAKAPEIYHGTGSFDIASGQGLSAAPADRKSFSDALGEAICDLGSQDSRVVAVTAGMCHGTGLARCRRELPKQFFDVGIAEEHAVIFAAGMAAKGFRPVVVIYASFMHRAMDYVFHDVCLQGLPVVFCLDRAGVVPDGPTHHGIHDLGFWRTVPNLDVLQPADGQELREMLGLALARSAPCIIRYPKADAADLARSGPRPALTWGRAEILREGQDVVLWGVGREAATALRLAERLASAGIRSGVVNPRFAIPHDGALLGSHLQSGVPLVIIEDHCVEGGFGSLVREQAADCPGARVLCRGWPRTVLPWGTEAGIRCRARLDDDALAEDVRAFLKHGGPA